MEKAILLTICNRPIAFHPILARITGGALPGLFLSQCLYWTGKGANPDGWFHKTSVEWSQETCMTRREQENARSILREKGFIEENKTGLPAKLFFRVAIDEITLAISNTTSLAQTRVSECDKLDARNVTNLSATFPQTNYTEITSETTTENRSHPSKPSSAVFNPVSVMMDGFKSRHGRFPVLKGQTVKEINIAGKTMGEPIFRQAVETYFRTDGRWQAANNWDVATFIQSPDKYVLADAPVLDYDWTKDEENHG